MKYLFSAITGVVILLSGTQAQTPHNVQFQTPEVSAFNRHVETPVSLFTGIPNISIPLYEIKTRDITLPVILNYTGGGIKVEEEATWVGLGWNLNCGGQITRKQRGIKDEQYFMRTNTPAYSDYSIASYNSLPHVAQDPYLVQRYTRIGDAKKSLKDYMPDEFYYSVPGYSGRFMFNQLQNKFVLFPKEDLKIDYTLSNLNYGGYPTSDYHVDVWNIKLPNGTNVSFGTDAACSDVSSTSSNNMLSRTGWNIKSIETQTPYNSIYFSYTPFTYSTTNLASETYNVGTHNYQSFVGTNTFRTSVLSQISFPGGNLEFITTDRLDMPGKALSQVNVKDNDGVIIKKIEFIYSYFTGNFNPITQLNYISEDYRTKRLRLDKIKISGNNVLPLEYQFDYYTSVDAPSKYSFSQDFWGYFNGATNSTLIPKTDINTGVNFGAERRPKPDVNNIFSLKSIQYPEGGKTEFTYECNTATADVIPSHFLTPASSNSSFYTGGIRIKSIKHYTSDGLLALQKKYDYTHPITGNTSGKLLTLPKYSEYTTLVTTAPTGNAPLVIEDIRLFSSSRVPLQTTGGAFLGYEKVTEESVGLTPADNLKTRYSYPFWDPTYNISFERSEATVVDANEWLRGKPSLIEYFKYNQPVKKEFFEYNQFSPHLTSGLQEDYVEEINTDFISTQALVNTAAAVNSGDEDFFDMPQGYNRAFIYSVDDLPAGISSYPSRLPYFKRYTGFDKPSSKRVVTFDDDNNESEQTEYYYYAGTPTHHQLTKNQTNTSTGQALESNMKYPPDMGAIEPYITMVQKNIIGRVIEQSVYKANTLVSRNKTNYVDPLVPSNEQVQIGTGPLEIKTVYSFDGNLNLKEIQKKDDVVKNYIWGERGYIYPAAEVIGASLADIAYTSFETQEILYTGSGGWSFYGMPDFSQADVPVGKRCFATTASSTFTKQGLISSKIYKVSYWSKGGQYNVSGTQSVAQGKTFNGWTFYEHKVTGVASVVVTGTTGYVDELKIFPAGALMTTYNYTSLGLLTYTCNPDNKVTRYEYDGLSRLIRIRDNDNNIIKQYDYQYNVKTNGIDVAPVWQNTGTSRCKPCAADGNYSINITQNLFQDNNPNSTTYLQTEWRDMPGNVNSCTVTSDWKNTGTNIRCKESNGVYTGEQEREQEDKNPCSSTYNQKRWQIVGINTTVCPLPVYAKLTYENYNYGYLDAVHADVVVRFYSDAACTIPISVSNLQLNYSIEGYNGTTTFSNDYSQTVSGNSFVLAANAELSYESGSSFRFKEFYVIDGLGYIPIFN